MKKFNIINKGEAADIYIYEDIGDDWFGGISAKTFKDELAGVKKAQQLNVFINSAGGNVFDGISIYNQLKRHPANVTVEIDGLAASIASLIAMAGDEIFMAENAMMMVHKPWGGVFGTAEEMRQYADTLDKVQDTLITTYTNRSSTDEKSIRALMDAETWMNAEEAAELGLIDTITEKKQMAAHVDLTKYNFKNVPKELPSALYTVDPERVKDPFELRKKYKAELLRLRQHKQE